MNKQLALVALLLAATVAAADAPEICPARPVCLDPSTGALVTPPPTKVGVHYPNDPPPKGDPKDGPHQPVVKPAAPGAKSVPTTTNTTVPVD